MLWYKITFAEKEVAYGALEKAHTAFVSKMLEYPGDKNMAVFISKNEEGSENILHVSPKMAFVSPCELAEFSAQKSAAPSSDEPEFGILVADDDSAAWSLIHADKLGAR